MFVFFFSSRRRHTRWTGDWSSDVCSSDLLVVARIETSRRLRDVHEMQRQIEMRCELRGDGGVRPPETPSAAFGAAEAYSLLAGPDLGGGDVRGKGGYNTVRLETELGQAWRTTRQRQGRQQRHHQGAGGQRCDIPCPRNQRRFHQTTPPSSMTLRGNSTSTAMNTVRIWSLVSVICCAGLKDCGLAAGLVSSSANHLTISTARSPFETYGK